MTRQTNGSRQASPSQDEKNGNVPETEPVLTVSNTEQQGLMMMEPEQPPVINGEDQPQQQVAFPAPGPDALNFTNEVGSYFHSQLHNP